MNPRNAVFTGLMILLFIALGAVTYLLIGSSQKNQKLHEQILSVKEMDAEIVELNESIAQLKEMLKDKEIELEIKDRLLKRNYLELAMLTDQLDQMEQNQETESEEVMQLRHRLAIAENSLQKARKTFETYQSIEGMVYRVQIGMLDLEDVFDFPDDENQFLVEEVDGYQKYLVGRFTSLEESQEFCELLRKLGVEDAWVVPYHNGVRTQLEDTISPFHVVDN